MHKDIEQILIREKQIAAKTEEIGLAIARDYADCDLVLIGALKGVLPFMADLIRAIDMKLEFDFIQASSYAGTESTGVVTIKKDITVDVTGRDVIVVEDIIDTGTTLDFLKGYLLEKGAKSVEIAAMLSKPDRRKVEVDVKYVGFEIPDKFVVGYGMDYNEMYRNLPYIGILSPRVYS
ncbi:MAG: hypoxanthine phosphoribosyltransferase [Lactobacillales bacterium]|jgi:hypoxanthine phosphoribosyltransferase|nr:hypoxanthine phosphoribosyltransferase [Lactobacillales bacterium]